MKLISRKDILFNGFTSLERNSRSNHQELAVISNLATEEWGVNVNHPSLHMLPLGMFAPTSPSKQPMDVHAPRM